MNVNFEKTDQVNGVLTVAIVEDDYKADVKKELNKLGMTRPIKGFRPGHVPAALLQKMYGPQVKAQVVDHKLNRAVSDYLINNHIAVLGEPMLTDDTNVNIDNDVDFEFKFNIGMAPEFELNIDKSINVPYYNIGVTDDMVEKQNEGYRKRFGKQVPGEEAAIDSLLRGSLVELDENGDAKAEGISTERTIVMPQYLHDEEQKQKFVGAKVGQEIVFNPHKACDGSASELASMLNIDKENAADVTSDFKMTVNEIMVTQIADMDQEFFDNVLGKDVATNEEEYMTKLRETIAHELVADSNYRFTIDAETVLKKKVGELELPDEFLKQYLLSTNKDVDATKIEEEYPRTREEIVWQLIKEKIAKAYDVKIEKEDQMRLARIFASQQFAQYGIGNVPEETLDRYAGELMENKDYSREISRRAFEDKVYATIRDNVSLTEKSVTVEEFNKLFEEKK